MVMFFTNENIVMKDVALKMTVSSIRSLKFFLVLSIDRMSFILVFVL